jgi:hypothetical protein
MGRASAELTIARIARLNTSGNFGHAPTTVVRSESFRFAKGGVSGKSRDRGSPPNGSGDSRRSSADRSQLERTPRYSPAGVMDLVLEEHSGPLIVDFKTAARADQLSELRHEIQLGCYAYLFRQTTGSNESGLEVRRLVKTKGAADLFSSVADQNRKHFARLSQRTLGLRRRPCLTRLRQSPVECRIGSRALRTVDATEGSGGELCW